MAGEDEKTDHLRVVTRHDFPDGEKIAQGLGHFLIVNPHKPVVHPDLGEDLAVRPATLGDLVFMVGELQVLAAAVDVKIIAQAMG